MNDKYTRTLLIGTIIGAITGLAASYVLIKRADDGEKELRITPKEGVKLGVGIASLFRLITSLND
jgi:gas vesicle protein